jgi:hypothetical protein
MAMKRKRFRVRELIMLQKITASMDSTDVIRKAMSIFGGHGIMEDFSSLPRLYRDSAINELWEGPRNVLLTQIHRDIQRVRDWYPPAEFVADILDGAESSLIKQFTEELESITAHPNLFVMDEKTVEICSRLDEFSKNFFHAYQELALAGI